VLVIAVVLKGICSCRKTTNKKEQSLSLQGVESTVAFNNGGLMFVSRTLICGFDSETFIGLSRGRWYWAAPHLWRLETPNDDGKPDAIPFVDFEPRQLVSRKKTSNNPQCSIENYG
jgi:hypothetical protein